MALFDIHIHVSANLEETNKKIDFLTQTLIQMAKTAEELKQEFLTVTTEIKDSIANVAADIDRLIDGTNPAGGLTEAEVEEQLSELRDISSALKTAADKVIEPPVA